MADAKRAPSPKAHVKAGEAAIARRWKSVLLMLASGFAWVYSIPQLLLSLGGSMAPHLGWAKGICTALALFCVLVQLDQRIAAATVCVVSFTSALLASPDARLQALICAVVASATVMLNAVERTCNFCPRLFNFQCSHYAAYHKRAELGGSLSDIRPGRTLFSCHPHGVLSVGWITNLAWGRSFHKAAGRCMFLIDATLRNKGLLARVFLDACEGPHGGFRDNAAKTLQKLMKDGESVAMLPGGFQEATLFVRGKDRVAINGRKGFVKYCLRYGYRLHPVYTFGESDTYTTLTGLEKFRLWLNSYGIPTVAPWGLPWCPLLPHSAELLTFVGPALELPQITDPTGEQVNEWHAKYVVALRALFDKHKADAGRPDAELEVL